MFENKGLCWSTYIFYYYYYMKLVLVFILYSTSTMTKSQYRKTRTVPKYKMQVTKPSSACTMMFVGALLHGTQGDVM
jgi:hypothetical protein